jgi:general stress protein 26
MKNLQALLIAPLFLLALLNCASSPAPPAHAPLDDAGRIAAARQLMSEARYCALITIGDDGQPQARTIDPSAPDERLNVWFVTNPATRKVRQIEHDARVTLYYFVEKSMAYVTVIGTAHAVSDAEKQQRWIEKWTPIYPGGRSSATVFEVTPVRIEVVDIVHGVVGDSQTWMPPSVTMRK